jgi:hypothetical protein
LQQAAQRSHSNLGMRRSIPRRRGTGNCWRSAGLTLRRLYLITAALAEDSVKALRSALPECDVRSGPYSSTASRQVIIGGMPKSLLAARTEPGGQPVPGEHFRIPPVDDKFLFRDPQWQHLTQILVLPKMLR